MMLNKLKKAVEEKKECYGFFLYTLTKSGDVEVMFEAPTEKHSLALTMGILESIRRLTQVRFDFLIKKDQEDKEVRENPPKLTLL